jgi:ABC-type multidrug transport system ATPase subunit
MLSLHRLSKSYPGVSALQDISLEVRAGELFGILGPDGAGKTTLFRILATLLLPDHGSGRIDGLDLVRDYRAIRRRIGYMPGKFSLYQDLSVGENLEFFARVFGVTVAQRYDWIRDIYAQLAPFRTRRAGALSGGMKQKLALSCALIHQPQILLLDEPGTGVDPVSRQEFWDLLLRLKAAGMTILVSTPNMDEAAKCDRIALLQRGRILALDTPDALANAYPLPLYAVRAEAMYPLIRDLRGFGPTARCYAFGEYAHLALQTPTPESEIRHFLESKGHREVEVFPIPATIEDSFIHLMEQSV